VSSLVSWRLLKKLVRLSATSPTLSQGVLSTSLAARESVFPDVSAQLLPGDRVLLGTVEELAGEQARIDTGEVQPRYISMNVRTVKELSQLKIGRSRRDYGQRSTSAGRRPYGRRASNLLVVQGRIIEPLATGIRMGES
jgi:hypothetical protein